MKRDEGIEELFKAEFERLVAALAAATGDPEMAADAVQAAFVQAHFHWRRVSQYAAPAAWVRRVAVNRLRNERRGQRRRLSAIGRLSRERASGDGDPGERLALPGLAPAIAALPERQRLALALYYLGGLSVHEVAEAMGVAPGTVKSHLHRARSELARRLEVDRDES